MVADAEKGVHATARRGAGGFVLGPPRLQLAILVGKVMQGATLRALAYVYRHSPLPVGNDLTDFRFGIAFAATGTWGQ